MTEYYVVEWYKECYPRPDESGKLMFTNKLAARTFWKNKVNEGYQTRFVTKHYNEDEEDAI